MEKQLCSAVWTGPLRPSACCVTTRDDHITSYLAEPSEGFHGVGTWAGISTAAAGGSDGGAKTAVVSG
ncbi:hypothetical protein BAUCODRAFT_36803 [Baudoinia panamericana UAMH 10762]|uniref:Uncharacterized protein n=1 Tax=Baudoinia panamericana (strain UAMH 10762) TaxID=717646 RepID=M2LGE3_BAUPA|nr:uncharacterized protein BAUCODRAFT_36803 [Baudoinia panamericana UAMH 10762]EMC93132.1 hypothetical protein BAUCODRAFT_36803 [Baudoinia panamericana UAMH 10762]